MINSHRKDFSEKPGHNRAFVVLLYLFLAYILVNWISAAALMEGEDKEFHLLALDYGLHKATEPLWGVIANQIGVMFPEDPFGAAVVLVYALLIFALVLNAYPWAFVPWILFSPGLVYLASQALRQGTAVGVLLVSIGLLSIAFGQRGRTPGVKILIAPLIVTSLIHNSIGIAAAWLLLSRASSFIQNRTIVLIYHAHTVLISLLLVTLSAQDGRPLTALVLIGLQLVTLIQSMRSHSLQHDYLQASLFFMTCAAGFILTTTGLRVVIMLVILLPLVFKNVSRAAIIFGLVVYPLVSSYLSGEGGFEKMIPAL